mmetsp:Transcript_9723/g.24235  ORF Transcript_9723/g.24235 Transcript_9723/m.24235 type:complete len:204 (-) Transcript_9723:204-815(-)
MMNCLRPGISCTTIWVPGFPSGRLPSMHVYPFQHSSGCAIAIVQRKCRRDAWYDFFSSLYSVLKKSARAVLQFYPETAEQAVLISECATAVGFGGGIVVDYPNSAKAKKHYLVLSCDRTSRKQLPKGMTGEEQMTIRGNNHVQVSSSQGRQQEGKRGKAKPIRKKKGVKTKEWILHKKETQRKKGKIVRPDTKYTARRRRGKF